MERGIRVEAGGAAPEKREYKGMRRDEMGREGEEMGREGIGNSREDRDLEKTRTRVRARRGQRGRYANEPSDQPPSAPHTSLAIAPLHVVHVETQQRDEMLQQQTSILHLKQAYISHFY